MKSNILFFALCLIISLSSCGDNTINPKTTCEIEGNWNVTSIIEVGDELMGEDVEWLTMKFENNNEFRWDGGLYDENLQLSGIYSKIDYSNLKLNFNPNEEDFTNINFSIELNENELSLEGLLDDEWYVIKAVRIQ